MTRLPERLPAPLSERLASASAALYERGGREVDVAIAGIPFMLATSPETPQTVETIQVRKDQFDTELDPGEQTLTGWWRRSQASFHEGAGFRYAEDSESNQPGNGFWDSRGVDVFTKGEARLHRLMVAQTIGTNKYSRVRTFAAGSTRTNLCTNPSAETDATGWSGGGSVPPTVTRSTTRAFVGAASIRGVWGTAGTLPLVQGPTWTATIGVSYTVSAYVYVPSGSPNVTIVVGGMSGSTGLGPSSSVVDQWVRLPFTFTAQATTHSVQVWPTTPPTAGQEVYVDAVLIEASSVTGSYFDGSSPGAAWTGTVNNSTSTLTTASANAEMSHVLNGTFTTTAGLTHAPASKTIVDGVVSATTFHDIASDGTLYRGDVSAPGSATTWPCGGAPTRLGWGKHRLWVIGGRSIWQPDLSLAGGTAQNPIFTHPNVGWSYTCMAEGPGAMYFGGSDGLTSSIQTVTLQDDGFLPTLSGATTTALMPPGELVQEIEVLAGQFIGIGTNKGFRVGAIAQNGTINYGPLLIEPPGVIACTAITSHNRFFEVAFSQQSSDNLGAFRVDTGLQLDQGVFPYARSIECASGGAITSLAVRAGNFAATTANGGLHLQDSTVLVSSGYIHFGRVRFRTTELKAFKDLAVEIDPLAGAVSVDLILEGGGGGLPLGSLTAQGEVATGAFAIGQPPQKHVSPYITLTRSASATSTGPVLRSYLLRAIPAVTPQRLYTLPLLCFDREQAKSGQRYGGDGYAADRLAALQLLEDVADTVTFQDFSAPHSAGIRVVVESIRFVRTSPPTPNHTGGILVLQLRTI